MQTGQRRNNPRLEHMLLALAILLLAILVAKPLNRASGPNITPASTPTTLPPGVEVGMLESSDDSSIVWVFPEKDNVRFRLVFTPLGNDDFEAHSWIICSNGHQESFYGIQPVKVDKKTMEDAKRRAPTRKGNMIERDTTFGPPGYQKFSCN